MPLFATALLVVGTLQDPGAIAWQTDLEHARALARDEGRPLLAVFRCEA